MQELECEICNGKSFTLQNRGFNFYYALSAFIPIVLIAMLIWYDIIPNKNSPGYRLNQATDELQRELDRMNRADGQSVPYREEKVIEDPTKNFFIFH